MCGEHTSTPLGCVQELHSKISYFFLQLPDILVLIQSLEVPNLILFPKVSRNTLHIASLLFKEDKICPGL